MKKKKHFAERLHDMRRRKKSSNKKGKKTSLRRKREVSNLSPMNRCQNERSVRRGI